MGCLLSSLVEMELEIPGCTPLGVAEFHLGKVIPTTPLVEMELDIPGCTPLGVAEFHLGKVVPATPHVEVELDIPGSHPWEWPSSTSARWYQLHRWSRWNWTLPEGPWEWPSSASAGWYKLHRWSRWNSTFPELSVLPNTACVRIRRCAGGSVQSSGRSARCVVRLSGHHRVRGRACGRRRS